MIKDVRCTVYLHTNVYLAAIIQAMAGLKGDRRLEVLQILVDVAED